MAVFSVRVFEPDDIATQAALAVAAWADLDGAFAGANGLPDVIEEPRTTLGFAYIQGFRLFKMDWNLKLSGENLTDERWNFTQGTEVWRAWNPGRKIGLSVGLTVF